MYMYVYSYAHAPVYELASYVITPPSPFIGSPVTFPITVEPARNFPVDIYLLMDLSFSMEDDLVNLRRLGATLG